MILNQTFSGGFATFKQWTSSIFTVANRARLGILVMLVGLASCSVFAATTGSISGTVKDAQGAVVAGATVRLHNELTGVELTVQSDSSGFYNFPSIAIGTYDVSFEKSGFEKYTQTKVVIDVDTAQRIDAALNVGSVSENVTVISTEAQVDTTDAQIGDVISGQEMAEMPNAPIAHTPTF